MGKLAQMRYQMSRVMDYNDLIQIYMNSIQVGLQILDKYTIIFDFATGVLHFIGINAHYLLSFDKLAL